MCVQQSLKKTQHRTLWVYLLVIVLGIVSGFSDSLWIHQAGTLIADVFIKIFKCISMPLIALSLIVTLSSYSTTGGMPSLWQRTVCYTLGTTLIAATVSCFLYLLVAPSNVHIGSALSGEVTPTGNYMQYLLNLIPANIFSPFLEHQVMGVLFIGIIVGIAIRYIPEEKPRQELIYFFKGLHGLFLVITKGVVAIIPVGLYGFITVTVLQLREGIDLQGIGEYLAIVVLANLVQGLIVLPLWLKWQGLAPFVTLRGMLPALSLAFFSKSSAGTLPVTMETAEKNLQLNPKISRFVLPFCTSINMNGCAAFIFATVIFLMQNHGVPIGVGTLMIWIFISTIAAVGNAGVPMGCFFLSASLLASMNVPITLLGLILPFYSLLDMLETALNVWSDACVATVVNEKMRLAGHQLQEGI